MGGVIFKIIHTFVIKSKFNKQQHLRFIYTKHITTPTA